VGDRILTWSPTLNRQSIAAFSAPVSRAISFQRMLAGVVIQLTATMCLPTQCHRRLAIVILTPMVVAFLPMASMLMMVASVLVAAVGLGDELRRQQLHSALRAVAGLLADHLRMYGRCRWPPEARPRGASSPIPGNGRASR